jgi:thiol-disulfide isomerase/thioredoxin
VTASPRLCDELDGITESLDLPQIRKEQLGKTAGDSDRRSPDISSPMDRVIPFENLADFKEMISQCEVPVVAAYISDDDASRAVDSAMKQLVGKYHNKAAFISVDSKFRDIAIESKIKSYPAILVFNNGKVIADMKSVEMEQLDRELSTLLEQASATCGVQDQQRQFAAQSNNCDSGTEMKQNSGIRKLGVAGSP